MNIYLHLVLCYFVHFIPTTSKPGWFSKTVESTILNQFIYKSITKTYKHVWNNFLARNGNTLYDTFSLNSRNIFVILWWTCFPFTSSSGNLVRIMKLWPKTEFKEKYKKSELFMSFSEMVLTICHGERTQGWQVLNGASGPIQNLQSGERKQTSLLFFAPSGQLFKTFKSPQIKGFIIALVFEITWTSASQKLV